MNLNKLLALSVLAYGNVVLGMISNNNETKKTTIGYKVLLVGDMQVGKTQIATNEKFNQSYTPTVGFEFSEKGLSIGKKPIQLDIWDLSGDNLYKSALLSIKKNSHAIVFVYDITKQESFNNMQGWIDYFVKEENNDNNIFNNDNNTILNQENKKKTPLYFLVGNKTDLRDNNGKEQVTTKEGKELAEKNNMDFYEVSAKNGEKINELFEEIVKKCLEKFGEKTEIEENINRGDMFFKNSRFGETHKESYWKSFRSCCSKLAFWEK